MVKIKLCALVMVGLMASACNSNTEPAVDPSLCPQTYEFGNYGCARVVVLVDGPPEPLPAARRWSIAARLLTPDQGMVGGYSYDPGPGLHVLEFTRMFKMQNDTVDAMPAWVSARVLDETLKNVSPLPVIAADSVLHVFRFAPVGARPVVDTLHLTLRR